jgi:hypothetical protein
MRVTVSVLAEKIEDGQSNMFRKVGPPAIQSGKFAGIRHNFT